MLPETFTTPFRWEYLIFAVVIFFARIVDVSAHTVRIILLSKGKRLLPSIISFFEVMVWIMVITHLVKHIAHWTGYVGYASGFAAGTYLGTLIDPNSITVFLKNIFRMTLSRTVRLELFKDSDMATRAYAFIQAQGLAWKVSPDIISKAIVSLNEALETICSNKLADDNVIVFLKFDEPAFDIELSYPGRPMVFPEARPNEDEILTDPQGLMKLSGYIIRNSTAQISDRSKNGECNIIFHFGTSQKQSTK